MTTITLQNLRKEFGDVTAVDGIDLAIEDGEFLVIVGPSGCGKSTTLRLLAGLEGATGGTIHMGGHDVTAVEPHERNVAMVFQNYALYPHMTGRRNVTFGMKSAGDFTGDEINRRVDAAAETLEITDLLDRKPAAMSGGERQRVALCRAIVRDPEAFLMDEPLSNLDAKLRIQMRAELTKLHEELGTTTVYVTHDQTEAMTLGERVVVMNDGRVMQVDTPQRLYDAPENRFVAEFIGDPAMNTLDVEVADGRATHEGLSIPLPGTDPDAVLGEPDGDRPLDGPREAVLGVRPEDVHVAEERADVEAGSGDLDVARFEATVEVEEPLGDCLLLHCVVGGETLTVQTSPRASVAVGEPIELAFDPARLHLFDPDTGAAFYHAERFVEDARRVERVDGD
jgi:multiple sugar transport system ATP-binding protein